MRIVEQKKKKKNSQEWEMERKWVYKMEIMQIVDDMESIEDGDCYVGNCMRDDSSACVVDNTMRLHHILIPLEWKMLNITLKYRKFCALSYHDIHSW